MTNFIKGSLGGILFLVILSFMTGTTAWAAVDILDVYTENQFTGRVKAFDIGYWNAVVGSGFIFLCVSVVKAFIAAVSSFIQAGKEEEEEE